MQSSSPSKLKGIASDMGIVSEQSIVNDKFIASNRDFYPTITAFI